MSSSVRFERVVNMTDKGLVEDAVKELGMSHTDQGKDSMIVKDSAGHQVCSIAAAGDKGMKVSGTEIDDAYRTYQGSEGVSFRGLGEFTQALTGTYNILDAELKMRREGYTTVRRNVTSKGFELSLMQGG